MIVLTQKNLNFFIKKWCRVLTINVLCFILLNVGGTIRKTQLLRINKAKKSGIYVNH